MAALVVPTIAPPAHRHIQIGLLGNRKDSHHKALPCPYEMADRPGQSLPNNTHPQLAAPSRHYDGYIAHSLYFPRIQ
jgi:hypothetical protein